MSKRKVKSSLRVRQPLATFGVNWYFQFSSWGTKVNFIVFVFVRYFQLHLSWRAKCIFGWNKIYNFSPAEILAAHIPLHHYWWVLWTTPPTLPSAMCTVFIRGCTLGEKLSRANQGHLHQWSETRKWIRSWSLFTLFYLASKRFYSQIKKRNFDRHVSHYLTS